MENKNPVSRALLPFARFLALIAGYGLLGLAFLVTIEILLRRFMNVSLQGGDEFGGYVLSILAAFGFSYALLERAHTRVEILVENVSSNVQAALNLLSSWTMAFAASFMAWRAWATLMESVEYKALSGTPLMTPLWQPQMIWFAGLVFFAITALAIAVHTSLLFGRDRKALNGYYGTKTIEEIIEEETINENEARGSAVR